MSRPKDTGERRAPIGWPCLEHAGQWVGTGGPLWRGSIPCIDGSGVAWGGAGWWLGLLLLPSLATTAITRRGRCGRARSRRGGHIGRVISDESRHLDVVNAAGETAFFLEERTVGMGEGKTSRVDGESGDAVAKVAIELIDEGELHVLVANRGAHVAKGVGDALEAAGERGDGEVGLHEVVELTLGEDGALEAVVEEEGGDCRPNVLDRISSLDDDSEDVLGDGGVGPGDDALMSPIIMAASTDQST